MKNKYILFYIIIISCLFSCKENRYKNAETITRSDFKETRVLNGERIEFNDLLMKPVSITYRDSLLYMKNRSTENYFHVFNPYTLSKIGEFGAFGNGPNDFMEPVIIQSDDHWLWILNQMKRSLSRYKIDFKEGEIEIIENNKIAFDDHVDQLAVLDNNTIIASMMKPEDKKFYFFNGQGELTATGGEYPESGIEFTNFEKIEGFMCQIAVNHKYKRIFVSHKQTDLIEIYDFDGKLLHRKHGPDHFFPVVKQTSDGDMVKVRSNPGTSRDGYFSPKYAGEEVFVLYSGVVFNGSNAMYQIDQIYVFDWEGTPLKIYKLDQPIFNFDVDVKNRVIYGLSAEPEFHVIAFKY